ncbi:MAG: hypothetical protein AAF585_25750, partial [Verrucomicrobiota bacterium]
LREASKVSPLPIETEAMMTPGPNHFSNDKGEACRSLAGGSGYRSGSDIAADGGENTSARHWKD